MRIIHIDDPRVQTKSKTMLGSNKDDTRIKCSQIWAKGTNRTTLGYILPKHDAARQYHQRYCEENLE